MKWKLLAVVAFGLASGCCRGHIRAEKSQEVTLKSGALLNEAGRQVLASRQQTKKCQVAGTKVLQAAKFIRQAAIAQREKNKKLREENELLKSLLENTDAYK